tara:strand:- start:303 stop:821 length:519 start_codon:yes stop_codon:yes gene_type:complete
VNWVKEIASSLEAEIKDEDSNESAEESEIDLSKETEGSTNNQGWGHSSNPAPLWHWNVRHRTWYEALFTEACIHRHILCFPLPLVLFGSKRIEPDYIIIMDGILELIELDGPSHDSELASFEQERLKPFRDNLVDVMRFPVPEEVDINWAHGVLDQVVERIDKRKALYGRGI